MLKYRNKPWIFSCHGYLAWILPTRIAVGSCAFGASGNTRIFAPSRACGICTLYELVSCTVAPAYELRSRARASVRASIRCLVQIWFSEKGFSHGSQIVQLQQVFNKLSSMVDSVHLQHKIQTMQSARSRCNVAEDLIHLAMLRKLFKKRLKWKMLRAWFRKRLRPGNAWSIWAIPRLIVQTSSHPLR